MEFAPREEILAKWLERLRDPNTKQAKGRLRVTKDSDGSQSYCCLGVLCEVAGIPTGRSHTYRDGYGERTGVYAEFVADRSDTSATALPVSLAEHMDMFVNGATNNGVAVRIEGKGIVGSLVEANDNAGYTFAEIADLIEQNETAFFKRFNT